MPSRKKPKRRLYNVDVDEISLVDRPAVPDSKFVIAKRDDPMDIESHESQEEIFKQLTDEETFDVQIMMRMVSDAVGVISALKRLKDRLPSEVINSCGDILKVAGISVDGFIDEIEKSDVGSEDEIAEKADDVEPRDTEEQAPETPDLEGLTKSLNDIVDKIAGVSDTVNEVKKSVDDLTSRTEKTETFVRNMEVTKKKAEKDRMIKSMRDLQQSVSSTASRINNIQARIQS